MNIISSQMNIIKHLLLNRNELNVNEIPMPLNTNKHPFIPSLSDNTKCVICKRERIIHDKAHECDSCTRTEVLAYIKQHDMWLCTSCIERDTEIENELAASNGKMFVGESSIDALSADILAGNNSVLNDGPITEGSAKIDVESIALKYDSSTRKFVPENDHEEMTIDANGQIVPLNAVKLIKAANAMEIDLTLHTSKDYFNAETVALVEVKNEIWNDAEIPAEQKNLRYVEFIRARYAHYRKVLFDVKEVEVEVVSRERALQHHLNDIATKFRVEEREKLKLQDLSYVPKETKITAPKIRLSPEDKLIESYAKLMKVTVEQAKVMFKNKMKLMEGNLITGPKDTITNE